MKTKVTDIDPTDAGAGDVPTWDGEAVAWAPGGSGGKLGWEVLAAGTGSSQNVGLPYTDLVAENILVFVEGLRKPLSTYTLVDGTVALTVGSGDDIAIVGPLGSVPAAITSTLWRFLCVSNNGGVLTGFAEVGLMLDATNLNTVVTTVTQKTILGPFVPESGIDNDLGTYSLSNFESTGWWFQWEFPAPTSTTGMYIDRGTLDTAGYLPNSWKVQYYDGSDWIDYWEISGEAGWGVNEERTYTF